MSYVTNVLLAFDILEDEEARIGEVNEALTRIDTARGQQLGDIAGSDAYGGHKHMEIPLWGAAFNHLGPEHVLDAVRAAAWEYRENVQVFICDQEDDNFRLVGLEATS